jgi:hypothetical protein
MNPLSKLSRREDMWTAETVQYGLALRTIVGLAEAERYLLYRCVPQHVVDRVLSVTALPRRHRGAKQLLVE